MKMRESAALHSKKPHRVKIGTEVMVEQPKEKTEWPLYVIKRIINLVAALILFCCGVGRIYANLGISSMSLAGVIFCVSQARWELDHSAEPRKSLASSTDTTVGLEDGDESLPSAMPVPTFVSEDAKLD